MTQQEKQRVFVANWSGIHQWDLLSAWLADGFHVQHPLVALKQICKIRWEVVPPQALSNGEVTMLDKVTFSGEVIAGGRQKTKMEQYLGLPGDIIVSKIRARQGSVGLVNEDYSKIGISIHYRALIPDNNQINHFYLWLALRSTYARTQFIAATGGAAKGEISEENLMAVQVPLPPLAIQKTIVERWKQGQQQALALEEDAATELENVATVTLSKLGISLPEPASVRQKCFLLNHSQMERWSFDYSSRITLQRPTTADSIAQFVMLGDIADISYGIQKSPENRPGFHARPYLRVANVQSSKLDLSQIKYINISDDEIGKYLLQDKDILVCEGNSADLVGRPALWRSEIEGCVHQNHILKVRVQQELALPEYLIEYMLLPVARNYFRANAKFTTNLASINSNDLRNLPILLPTLDIQRQIVKRVAEARAEAGRLHEEARRVREETKAEVEAMILGTKAVQLAH